LSVRRILLLQRKPKLGRGLDIADLEQGCATTQHCRAKCT